MDKFKTSQMGVALKKVFRGESTTGEAVEMVKTEISAIFADADKGGENFDGFVGDEVGKCPVCGKTVTRTKFGYGCSGYRDGCKFSSGNIICGKVVSVDNMKKLLETGSTDLISGFVSKRTGKEFSARLAVEGGKVVFKF